MLSAAESDICHSDWFDWCLRCVPAMQGMVACYPIHPEYYCSFQQSSMSFTKLVTGEQSWSLKRRAIPHRLEVTCGGQVQDATEATRLRGSTDTGEPAGRYLSRGTVPEAVAGLSVEQRSAAFQTTQRSPRRWAVTNIIPSS
ncbi:predicted protein [Plenodomus lingam JN3]|uniref:Predicted protein n=1 Tax=Leptosphaeria maculans (strain JN3 / isolate v23.1.3 / race Av1-4-5-6-7-8) TaxID=985895 RepID=E4ZY81_LEPMJ|nr:predicted protein [Plenodomus lingam JN3]CBX96326.1 predicted protein [Plenodomus lingam JN3]